MLLTVVETYLVGASGLFEYSRICRAIDTLVLVRIFIHVARAREVKNLRQRYAKDNPSRNVDANFRKISEDRLFDVSVIY